MIKETEHFILENRELKDVWGFPGFLGTEDGLIVKEKFTDGLTTICEIIKLDGKNITIFKDKSLVDNITDWPLYQEFAQLLDEACYRIDLAESIENFQAYLK